MARGEDRLLATEVPVVGVTKRSAL